MEELHVKFKLCFCSFLSCSPWSFRPRLDLRWLCVFVAFPVSENEKKSRKDISSILGELVRDGWNEFFIVNEKLLRQLPDDEAEQRRRMGKNMATESERGKSHLNLNFINQTFDNLWLSIIEQCSVLLSFVNLHINVVRCCCMQCALCSEGRVRESMFA